MSDQETQAALDAIMAQGEPDIELEAWEVPHFEAFVALDDGRRFHVTSGDQRDLRQAQLAVGQKVADSENNVDKLQVIRATAWAALHRTGEIPEPWVVFDQICGMVQPLDSKRPVDPTQTGGAP